MTDEELIKRLRAYGQIENAAADRIEELINVRDTLRRLLAKQTTRAERLEAAIRELKHRWYLGDLQEKDFTAALKGADHE